MFIFYTYLNELFVSSVNHYSSGKKEVYGGRGGREESHFFFNWERLSNFLADL